MLCCLPVSQLVDRDLKLNHSEWVSECAFLQNFNDFCRTFMNSSFYFEVEKSLCVAPPSIIKGKGS